MIRKTLVSLFVAAAALLALPLAAQEITPQSAFDAAIRRSLESAPQEITPQSTFDAALAQSMSFEATMARWAAEDRQRAEAAAERERIWAENDAEMELAHAWFDQERARTMNSLMAASIPRIPIINVRYGSNAWGGSYSVPFGRYSGDGLVGIQEVLRTIDNNPPETIARVITAGRRGARQLAGGWTFEPHGMLKETIEAVNNPIGSQCQVVDRFQYVRPNGLSASFQPKGEEQACTFFLPGGVQPTAVNCAQSAPPSCQRTTFWSDDNQLLLDATSRTAVRMISADGTVETLRATGSYVPFNPGLFELAAGETAVQILGTWFTGKVVDRNGNKTTYDYDADGNLVSVTDPDDRVTTYGRDANRRVTSISAPGPGGRPLTYTLTWETLSWDPTVLNDVVCVPNPCGASGLMSYTTLQRIQIPDGRTYEFTYEDWGKLKSVTTPGGARSEFDYGVSGTPFINPTPLGETAQGTNRLHERRLVTTRDYPNGSGTPLTTTITHTTTAISGATATSNCQGIFWIIRSYAEGMLKDGRCQSTDKTMYLRPILNEAWDTTKMLEGTYYGNPGGINESVVPIGNLFIDFERASAPEIDPQETALLDVRPNKIVHKKDNVLWTEELLYEDSDIPAHPKCTGCTTFRTTGNVVTRTIRDSSGAQLTRTNTSYFHNGRPAYAAANLLRLPSSVVVRAPGGPVTRTEHGYDESALAPSGSLRLEARGAERGNATSMTLYKDAKLATGPIVTRATFFDTGDAHEQIDPRGGHTTFAPDFHLCSQSSTWTTQNTNALGHVSTALIDCSSQLPLANTDPNGQTHYSQYDSFGRLVETAGPGDLLTALPAGGATGYLRAAGAPTTPGSVPGANGNGPTTWTEYLALGVVNSQRKVVHSKDGTADGHYTKSFMDGLDRTVQTRTESDPATSSGAEIVTSTTYDNFGRVSEQYEPCFDAARDTATGCTSASTSTRYDVLGRPISLKRPGLNPTTYAYDGVSSLFQTTATSPRGFVTKSLFDVLGRNVEVDRQSPLCGAFCISGMSYDAAGRMITMTDPGKNVLTITYDGLGRKTAMSDPDMGSWTYDYDDNGNLTRQTDAKGQVISLQYDALNRVTYKDLPPAGPSTDDVSYFYDGNGPQPPDVCSFTLSPGGDPAAPASGGARPAIHVAASDPSCSWAATTLDSYVTITGGATGTGDGTVTYSLAPNSAASVRGGLIAIGGQTFPILQQAGGGGCSVSITPSGDPNAPAAGGARPAITVTAGAGCSWSASTTDGWITITGGASGTGNGSVSYSLAANTSTSSRSGTITITGNTFSVTQLGVPPQCTLTLTPSSDPSAPAAGGARPTITVSANVGSCTWSATAGAAWIHVTAPAGTVTGSGSVSYTLDANTSTASRSGSITIGANTFNITQLGIVCQYTVAPSSANVTTAAGTGQFTVTTSASCTWTASVNGAPSWIRITAGSSGTGNGTVSYSYDANPGAARSAMFTIAGQSVTVNQAGVPCSQSLNPTGNSGVPASGLTGATIAVTSNLATCAWTAVSGASWITITGGASGTGNGTVTYNVASNLAPGATARSGVITIGNQQFTVFQDACSYFPTPTSFVFSSNVSNSNSVTVHAGGGCPWTAASNAPWITITSGATGSGSGTVQFTVSTNTQTTYPTSRTGTMTVAGQTITVTQAGQPACGFGNTGLSSDSLGFNGTSGKCFSATGSASPTTIYVWLKRTDCPWQPVVDSAWIHVTSVVDPGSNPRQVIYTVDANPGSTRRAGTIFIDGIPYNVTEDGTITTASGRVTTSTGQPLAGVTITFSSLIGGALVPSVTTDANGNWTQSGFVSCKGWYATASKTGYTFTPAPRNFFNPGDQHVDFTSTP